MIIQFNAPDDPNPPTGGEGSDDLDTTENSGTDQK